MNCVIRNKSIVFVTLFSIGLFGNADAGVKSLLGESVSSFGSDLLENLGHGGKNTVVSPFSIHTVLAMMYSGSTGRGRSEIAEVLGVSDDAGRIGSRSLLRDYERLLRQYSQVPRRPSSTSVSLANRVYVDDKFDVKESYRTVLRDRFLSDAETLDLQRSSSVRKINDWIEDRTAGKIRDLIKKFGNDAAMALVNAVYFKGRWLRSFEPKLSFNSTFFGGVSGRDTVRSVFMTRKDSFRVAELEDVDARAIEIPYETPDYRMVVYLPNEKRDGVARLLRGGVLRPENVRKTNAKFTEKANVILTLPRFHAEYENDLSRTLKSMGVVSVFNEAGQLRDISDDTRLRLTKVIHKSVVDTDEAGSRAVAATVAEFGTRSAKVDHRPVIPFNVDRTFLFVIEDAKNQVPLFAGCVSDPTGKNNVEVKEEQNKEDLKNLLDYVENIDLSNYDDMENDTTTSITNENDEKPNEEEEVENRTNVKEVEEEEADSSSTTEKEEKVFVEIKPGLNVYVTDSEFEQEQSSGSQATSERRGSQQQQESKKEEKEKSNRDTKIYFQYPDTYIIISHNKEFGTFESILRKGPPPPYPLIPFRKHRY